MERTEFREGDIIAGQFIGIDVPVDADDYESGMVAISAGQNSNNFKAGTKIQAESASVRGIFYIGGTGKRTGVKAGEKLTMLTGFSEVFGSKLKAPNGDPLGPDQKTKNNLLYHAEIIVR